MALFGKILMYIVEKDVDALFTQKINAFTGNCFASNEVNEIYGEVSEVNGFKFLNFKILGPFYTHIYNGCKVIFISGDEKLEVESDTLEIHTDYSKKLKMGITSFDIDLEQSLENLFRSGTITKVEILIDKKILSFNINTSSLIEILDKKTKEDEKEIESNETEPGNENLENYNQIF